MWSERDPKRRAASKLDQATEEAEFERDRLASMMGTAQ
jgi:hypothetical protein